MKVRNADPSEQNAQFSRTLAGWGRNAHTQPPAIEVRAPHWRAERRVSSYTRLLVIDRALRTHPGAVATISIGAVAGISLMKLYTGGEVSLALGYGIPLSLCAYSVGPAAGVIMAGAVALLWTFDAWVAGASAQEAAYSFLARLVTNIGIVCVTALGAAAARAREYHLGEQQRLEGLRTDLVSAFSHDLRTPLAAIVGYAELLRDDLASDDIRRDILQALDGIAVNANHLTHLITDLITIERGVHDAPLRTSAFAPEALVAELRREFEYTSQSKNVTLKWSVAPDTPSLCTDQSKLTSVVRNLVSNALKFTPAGGTVWIRIAHRSDIGAHTIEVEDTGPGIAADDLPHIFERFRQGNSVRPGQGFGLGLFIVERLTRMLGGSVAVTSEPGRGACFSVTLPSTLASMR
jgi:signal transduction histidine kinase